MLSGTKLKGRMGLAHLLPPNPEILPFRRAKTVALRASAAQLTGPRTIGELLLLKKNITDKKCSQDSL